MKGFSLPVTWADSFAFHLRLFPFSQMWKPSSTPYRFLQIFGRRGCNKERVLRITSASGVGFQIWFPSWPGSLHFPLSRDKQSLVVDSLQGWGLWCYHILAWLSAKCPRCLCRVFKHSSATSSTTQHIVIKIRALTFLGNTIFRFAFCTCFVIMEFQDQVFRPRRQKRVLRMGGSSCRVISAAGLRLACRIRQSMEK